MQSVELWKWFGFGLASGVALSMPVLIYRIVAKALHTAFPENE